MDIIVSWLAQNREWFLSGIGGSIITIALAILGWVFNNPTRKSTGSSSNNKVEIYAKGNVTYYGEATKNCTQRVVQKGSDSTITLVAVGLVVTLVAVTFIHWISPSNIKAQISAGSLGLAGR